MPKSKRKKNVGVISYPLYPPNASKIVLMVAICWRDGGSDPVSVEPVSVAEAGKSNFVKPQHQ